MCGRIRINVDKDTLVAVFGVEVAVAEHFVAPLFNSAPSNLIWVVRQKNNEHRELTQMRWGLIPRWAKDSKIGNRAFNARIETLAEKPMFRDALKARRCLVPVSGFYEWQTIQKTKQPYLVEREGEPTFALAGLWESWISPDGEVIESCTVITQPAPDELTWLHDRAPLLLPNELYDSWLDPRMKDAATIQSLLQSAKRQTHLTTREVDRKTLR